MRTKYPNEYTQMWCVVQPLQKISMRLEHKKKSEYEQEENIIR